MLIGGLGVERVYLACGSTDMRKSIDGLAALVSQSFQLDPFSPALFVFRTVTSHQGHATQVDLSKLVSMMGNGSVAETYGFMCQQE